MISSHVPFASKRVRPPRSAGWFSRKAAGLCVLTAILIVTIAGSPSAMEPEEMGLPEEVARLLKERGFVVVPGGHQDFPETYDALAEQGFPAFITSDSVLRATDLLIDRVLMTMETAYLHQRLEQLSREMIRLLDEDYLRSSDPIIKDAARRDMAFFAVGLSLLDPDYFPPESIRGLVERELELIEEADRTVSSPIMGPTPLDQVLGPGEDYTRYVPFGHYAAHPSLGRYFRAVRWYSRMAFALPERPVEDYALTIQALLVVRALEREAGEWLELWEDINYPLQFFCGGAGDPTVADYMLMADEVFGKDFEREIVTDEALLSAFVDRVSEMAPAHVQTHELRGMRFLPRDYPPVTDYFGLLASSTERPLPTSLDIMSLLGSSAARALLDQSDVFDSSVYRQSYEDIARRFETMTYADWTRDLYWSWLYALSELQRTRRPGSPSFVLDAAWGFKELSTGGAAWAAIRYKAADRPLSPGSGRIEWSEADIPALVEPYPEFYARLREVLENLRDRLWEHYMLDEATEARLSEFSEYLRLLEQSSKSLLAGRGPGEAGRKLGDYRDVLSSLLGLGPELSSGAPGCVLLSDTAYEDLDTGRLLEQSVGIPDIVFVLSSTDGEKRVWAGAVYSFFETELDSRDELTGGGWPATLVACPSVRPYWAYRYLAE
ncbi:MAG: DUF3160 domain-containing protein [Candidatus Eisenbacteria bacterium]|nr:DUF3160 domain-containing protein [Candidatus Eisenbacteria bacterium]